MIKKLTLIILVGLLTLISVNLKSQDVNFSQPMNNPLLLNPSMMGMENSTRILVNSRTQWNNIQSGFSLEDGFSTGSFSFILPVFLNSQKWEDEKGQKRLDIGFNATGDRAGAFTRLNSSISVGYGLFVSKNNFLHTSINFGYLQNSLAIEDLTFDDQYQRGKFYSDMPSAESISNESVDALDVGFGFLWHYKNEDGKVDAFAGLSAYHLNQPDLSYNAEEEALPSRFSTQAGLKIKGKSDVSLDPTIIYTTQGNYEHFMAGLSANYKSMMLGCWYKMDEAIVLQTGFTSDKFKFHYSYDFGNSLVSRSFQGLMTHEVTVGIMFNEKY